MKLKSLFLVGICLLFGAPAFASTQTIGPVTIHVETADGVPVQGASYRMELTGYGKALGMCAIIQQPPYFPYPCFNWDQRNIQSQNYLTDSHGDFTVESITVDTSNPDWWENDEYQLRIFTLSKIMIPRCSNSHPTDFNSSWEDPSSGVMAGVFGEADQVINAVGLTELGALAPVTTVKLNTTEVQFQAVVDQTPCK